MATRTKIKAERVARTILLIAIILLLVGLVGAVIWGGSVVYRLFTSGGGETVRVPDVVQQAEPDALAMLSQAGLDGRVVQYDYNDSFAEGVVFKQNPVAKKPVRPGKAVSLWVSKGPANFTVPDLTGRSLSEAMQILANTGLTLGRIFRIYSETLPAGQVVNQDPAPGRAFTSPVGVDLVVADKSSPPLSSMPVITGLPLADAEQAIANANLHLTLVTYVADDTRTANSVVSQTPAAGEQVPLGTKVELNVAIPQAMKDARVKTLKIRFMVPRGPQSQRIKIKVFDELGQQGSFYDQVHAPDEIIDRELTVQGKATIKIFIQDMNVPYREDRI